MEQNSLKAKTVEIIDDYMELLGVDSINISIEQYCLLRECALYEIGASINHLPRPERKGASLPHLSTECAPVYKKSSSYPVQAENAFSPEISCPLPGSEDVSQEALPTEAPEMVLLNEESASRKKVPWTITDGSPKNGESSKTNTVNIADVKKDRKATEIEILNAIKD